MFLIKISEQRIVRFVVQTLFIFSVVLLAIKSGLWLAIPPYYALPLWFGPGVAVGLILLFGIRHLATIIVSVFFGYYFHNYQSVALFISPFAIAITMCVVSLLIVAVKFFLIRYFIKEDQLLRYPEDILKFLLLMIAFAVISFFIITLIIKITDFIPGYISRSVIITWIAAELISSLIFVPFFLSFSKEYKQLYRTGGYIEFVIIFLIILSIILIVFFLEGIYADTLPYILIPFIFWIAYRFNIRETVTSLVIVTVLSAYIHVQGTVKAYGNDFFHSLYLFQLYLLILIPVFLIINVITKEFRRAGAIYLSQHYKRKTFWDTFFSGKKLGLLYQSDILRLAVEYSPGTVVVTDISGKILYTNPAFTRITGYQMQEVLGKNPRIFKSGIHPKSFYNELWNTIMSGHTWKGEFYNKKKDGSFYWEEAIIAPVYTKSEITHFVCTKENITRQKKALAALKESESNKMALLKVIPDLIIVIDKIGLITDVYIDKPAKLYMHPTQMMGRKFIEILPPGVKEKFHSAIEQVFSNRELKTFEYSYKKNEVNIFEEARLIVSGENELLIIIRDISELKRNEQELKLAWEEAKKANAAKSTFLASISHEIRTPINAIIGFTELLNREVQEPLLSGYLSSIKSSSRTLLSLIEDILDLTKIEAGELSLKPEYIDLRSILNEIKNVFIVKMQQKKLELTIDIPEDFPKLLLLDELRIRQILMNLIGNAYKFTDKGKIEIVCRTLKNSKNKSTNYCDLFISVADTGIGISKDFQQQIFEAFKQQEQQDSRKYSGSGLGLAITKRIIEMMDGTISVKSMTGKGSSFSVNIPHILLGYNTEIKKSKPGKAEKVVFRDSTVLIADDVDTNRELLRGVIAGDKIRFIEATDGKHTIELAKKFKPDIILLDLNMPKADGFDVARIVKSHNSLNNIPIIAISAKILLEEEIVKAKYFDAILTKPIDIQELTELLKQFLPHSKYGIKIKKTIEKEFIQKIKKLSKRKKHILRSEINSLLSDFKTILDSSSFDEIYKFATRIKELSVSLHLTSLILIADKIIKASQNFDIEEMNKNLAALPESFNRILNEIDTKSI